MLTAATLDTLPEPIVALYDEYQQTVINDIARRLVKTGKVTDTAAWQLQRSIESGKVYETALDELAGLTGQSDAALRQMFENAGIKALRFDDAIYQAAGLNPLPLNLSPAMSQVLAAGLQKTQGIMRNLTMTTALNGQEAFMKAADLAYMQITGGAFDYQTAIKNAIKGAAHEGLRVAYPSGHSDHLDVALRRTTLTGVSQTVGQLQERRADEMGADLVQTSAHIGARPTHQRWQGQIFSRSGTHEKYPDFVSSTGYGTGPGLMGWNCRHSWFPFFEGISAEHYQQAELRDYADKTVTYNGDEMSVYDATQKQRAIERQIRQAKREAGALEAADIDSTAERRAVRHYQAQMRDFTRQTGLKRQSFREQVYGEPGETKRVFKAVQPVPIVPVKPKPYAEKLIEERYSDVPNDQRLAELHKNATERLKRIDVERNESNVRDAYKYAESKALLETKDRVGTTVQRDRTAKKDASFGIGKWGTEDEERLQKNEQRLTEIKTEVQHRKEWFDTSRQLEAVKLSNETGKVVLEKGDIAELIAKQKDVYIDNGWNPDKMGKPPYRPELFKTSDLSGAKIRHYIELPDGRIAHPDEIYEAKTRGRLIVVDEIKVPARDWTQRPGIAEPIEVTPIKKPDAYEVFVAENRRSLERATQITPGVLEAGAEGDLADYMYNFFAYDEGGNPIFSGKLLNDTKNDLFYNVYSLGKGNMTVDRMHPIREKAAALLSGHTQAGGKVFSLKERRILERMASADDDVALAGIDQIRDQRLRGALSQTGYGSGGGRRRPPGPKFVSAQTEDSLKYLRESNRPGWR